MFINNNIIITMNISQVLDKSSRFNIIVESNAISEFKSSIDDLLREVGQKVPTGSELELRFRSSKDLNYNFIEAFELLKQIKNYKTIEFTKVEAFGSFRNIYYYEDGLFDKSTIYKQISQEKERSKIIDFKTYPLGIRLALSKEKDIVFTQPENEQPKYKKYQTRYIFDFDTFEVHFSEIQLPKENKPNQSPYGFVEEMKEVKYDLEIEFKETSRLIDIVKFGYILLTQNISIINRDSLSNSILSNQRTIISSFPQIYKKDKANRFFDNKPISLGHSNIDLISKDYVVTNKLDGVHYNMVLSSAGVYLINSTDIIMVCLPQIQGFDNLISSIGNLNILDGELTFDVNKFQFTFNVFDVLVVKNKNISGMPYIQRMGNDSLRIADAFNSSNLNSLVKIEFKKQFFSNNIFKDTEDCLDYIHNKYGREYQEKDDGLIFISNGSFSNVIYKWKFPSRITIDGKVKFIKQDKYANIYKFECKTEKGYSPLYIENKELELVVNTYSFFNYTIKDGDIVEAEYSNVLNAFTPTRVRKDKIEPNFITVGKNTLDQILRPLNERMLLKHFKPKNANIPHIESDGNYNSYLRNKFDKITKVVVQYPLIASQEPVSYRERKYTDEPSPEVLRLLEKYKNINIPTISIPESTKEEQQQQKMNIMTPITFIKSSSLLTKLSKDEELKEKHVAPSRKQQIEELERKNTLRSLPVNKLEELELNFNEDLATARVGVIGEGSCFIHSILFSIFEKYMKLSSTEKLQYAKYVRNYMANNLLTETWASLGNGNVARLSVDQIMRTKLLRSELEDFENYSNAFKPNSNEDYFEQYAAYIYEKYEIIETVVQEAYNKFKKNIGGYCMFDGTMIEYASIFFECNFFIIKDITRELESISYDLFDPSKKTIFILNIDKKYDVGTPHYEPIVVIDENNKMLTTFDPDNELVLSALRHYNQKRNVVSRTSVVDEREEVSIISTVESSGDKDLINKEMNDIFSKYFMYDKSKKLKVNYL
jgi:hypothetical protein